MYRHYSKKNNYCKRYYINLNDFDLNTNENYERFISKIKKIDINKLISDQYNCIGIRYMGSNIDLINTYYDNIKNVIEKLNINILKFVVINNIIFEEQKSICFIQ